MCVCVCVCVCKQYLALNNLQGFMCHKTQPTNEISGHYELTAGKSLFQLLL